MKRTITVTLCCHELNRKAVFRAVNTWLIGRDRTPTMPWVQDGLSGSFSSIEVAIPWDGLTDGDFDSLVGAIKALPLDERGPVSLSRTVETIEYGVRGGVMYTTAGGSALSFGVPGFAARACIRSGYAALAAGFAAF